MDIYRIYRQLNRPQKGAWTRLARFTSIKHANAVFARKVDEMTKEEREAAERTKAWQKAVLNAAYTIVEGALIDLGLATEDQGGLVVVVPDPDGRPVRYFLRLTEVRA